MRILIYVIFTINIFCLVVSQSFFSTANYVYGKENILEDKPHVAFQPYLLAKKTQGNKNYITESDIIITIDEPDEKPHEKAPLKETTRKGPHSLDLAYEYIEKGKKYEARNMLSELYFAETDYDERNKLKKELDKLNAELVFSKKPNPDAVFYTVKSGDTLIKIASKFNTTYKSIMRINNKSRSMIRVGERLKILDGKISLLVDKSDFTLTMLLNGHFIKQYPVGIGRYDKTPVGTFHIKNKLKNPVWYSPEGIFQYGDPRNLLGTRWMGFEEKKDLYGYGIHGTTEPETVGKAISNGCIRLKNEDVEELYDFVKLKTEVVVQE